jgi:glyoxylase-like metal-dependent hydrolase (beta-lactamase superfamily II)
MSGDPSERLTQPIPGIVGIRAPLPPFAKPDHVNAYLAEGPDGGLVVIDTTLGWDDSLELLEHGARSMNRRLADVESIYVTHVHPDHVGLAGPLHDLSGAPVVCHPITERMLGRMHDASDSRMAEFLGEHGVEFDAGGAADFRESFPMLLPPLPARFEHVDAGNVVEFAGGSWTVHWTPGHDWGHIVFFREADSVLLSADVLLSEMKPSVQYTGEPEDPFGQFLDSLGLLARLDPAVVLPGHGHPFERGAERAHELGRLHEAALNNSLEALRKTGPHSAMELASLALGPDAGFLRKHMTLSETLAHLEYLRLRDRVVREKRDGVWYYAATSPVSSGSGSVDLRAP